MSTRSRIASGAVAVALVAGIGFGVAAFATSAPTAEPTPTTVSFERPASEFTDTATVIPAAEAGRAAKVEADRVAAEAAAAQAAQAEADRIASEQAAAEQATVEQAPQESYAAPVESDPWASKMRVPWVADPNPENTMGGYWDTGQCPNGTGSTGPDGNQYCD